MMSDIESMFYQDRIPKQDCDCLQFYWWPEGELETPPVVYRMVVHLFGAVSSPSCFNLALRQTAEDNESHFDSATKEAVLKNFYVDDLLKSVATEQEAATLAHNIQSLCQMGGFHLTKWVSNSRAVLETIPITEQAKDIQQLNLDCDELPLERALGVSWCVESDVIRSKITLRSLLPTRRNIFSTVSSVYDPLGLASPFVLPAKILLQDLCRQGIDWDQEISGCDLQRWQRWVTELPNLHNLDIQRCYKPSNFGEVISCQVHNFSDSSQDGYGIVSYIRSVNQTGQIHCR